MRLTTLTKYGLRALMRMTAAPDQTFTGGLEIGFSRNHSTRIMQRLAWRGSLDGRWREVRTRPPRTIRLDVLVRPVRFPTLDPVS